MKFFQRHKQKQSTPSLLSESVSVSVLKRLIPLARLNPAQLERLPAQLESYQAGRVIFNRGEIIDNLFYVLSGQVYLEGTGIEGLVIEAETFSALHPLASGHFFNITAIAKTDVNILKIPLSALEFSRPDQQTDQIISLLPKNLQHNQTVKAFLSAKNLKMPVLPDVVFKLRQAIESEADLNEIVSIINMDPSISAKLIQVANSPLYRGVEPIVSCKNAINRIGLLCTKNLVTSLSLSGLYRNRRKELNNVSRYYWRQSVYMSALSYVLANITQTGNPEEAMLAGLTSQIGVVPFLQFVDTQTDEHFNPAEIKAALPFVTTCVSAMVLDKWNFPDEIKDIPQQINNWFLMERSEQAQLADIVLLARYHSLLDGKSAKQLPPITSLPSFSHLKNGGLTADKSLKILLDAQEKIQDVMQLFPK